MAAVDPTGVAVSSRWGGHDLQPVERQRAAVRRQYDSTRGVCVLTGAVLVLSLTGIPPTPLDGIGMTGCTAYIAPDLLVTLAAAAGSASSTVLIPSAGLIGN